MFSPVVVVVFVAYFLALVGIAVVKARRMDAMSDYVLGGRRMSSFTSGLSASVGVLTIFFIVFFGGFLAVSRTDVFQAVLMLAGLIIMPIALLVVADEPFREVGGEPGGLNRRQ